MAGKPWENHGENGDLANNCDFTSKNGEFTLSKPEKWWFILKNILDL